MKRFFAVVLPLLLIFTQTAAAMAADVSTMVTVIANSSGDTGGGGGGGPSEIIEKVPLYINEILADPKEDDASNEFIELYNAGSEPIDLSGWKLDDAREDDGAYIFSGYVLEPDSYLALFRPETRITLNNDSDSVILSDPDGYVVDYFDFSSQGSGRSWGRNPDDFDEWVVFKNPTPGLLNELEVNGLPVAVIDVQKDTRRMKLNVTGANSYDPDGDKLTFLWEFEGGVYETRENPLIYEYTVPGEKIVRLTVTDSFGDIGQAEITFVASTEDEIEEELEVFPFYGLINEVMPSPEGKDADGEWVELYNENVFGIDLSGWYIDDAEGNSSPYKIPEGTVIFGNSYMLFSEPGLGLSFKNSEDIVRILDPNKNVNQEVSYSGARENWSYARQSFDVYEWTPLFTPGQMNEFPPPPMSYAPGSVVFEAVLPNPEGDDSGNEKIMLKNRLDEEVSLFGWRMADAGGSEKFFSDLILGAGERMTLTSSEFGLTLNNSDEQLTLFDATGNLIDEIQWKDSASGQWLLNPDSLEDGMEAEVARVVDGDTFIINFNEGQLSVRLIGVDTPETVHPFKPIEYYGKQASAFLTDLLSGQWVTLKFDENKIDKYGRVLAYVFLNDEMINERILEEGYGYAYTRFPFRYLDEFVVLEAEARAAGIGLWQNQKVESVLDGLIKAELLLTPEEELAPEDILLIVEEQIPELPFEEEPVADTAQTEIMPDCSSDFLKIDSFLPNPRKGEAVEYIRLINTGTEKVCLFGWSLDDVTDAGSKPFAIRGGAIAGGGVRTFRKQETKLALNNRDDCVNLIDPDGIAADQICYEKTHKNEIFTHAGGDWVPKPRAKKAKSTTVNTLRHRFSRDFISYQSDLPTKYYVGRIISFDDVNEVMVMELQPDERIDVSYASSPLNMTMTQMLIDPDDTVRVQVYEAGTVKHLLAIETMAADLGMSEASDKDWFWLFLLVLTPLCMYIAARTI